MFVTVLIKLGDNFKNAKLYQYTVLGARVEDRWLAVSQELWTDAITGTKHTISIHTSPVNNPQ